MFCSNCGKDLIEDSKFCAHCGTQVGATLQPIQEATDNSSKLCEASNLASQTVKKVAINANEVASVVAVQVGDLNGDGKVDMEDLKVAMGIAKGAAISATNEAVRIGKEALKSDMVKDAAAGAAVGAAVAIPVPIIGPIAGAAVGAGIGVYKNLTK